MGNKPQVLKEQRLLCDHPALGDAKVVQEADRQYIEAKFKIQNKSYDDWYDSLEKGRKYLTSEYLLLPQKTNFKHDEGLCGNTGTLAVQYPLYPYQLSSLINQRRIEHKLFKESELWYVLYALAVAKKDIKDRSAKLGDIKPESIFVSEEGKIKVANIYSWPNQHPSFIKAIDNQHSSQSCLLAPEDLNQLQRGALDNESNPKSQVFAIGATIMATGTLTDFQNVYNYRNKVFDLNAFRQRRREWGEEARYSAIFKSIILNLTDGNPGQRLSVEELVDFVSQHEEAILDKRQFVLERVPPQIERSFSALQSQNYY